MGLYLHIPFCRKRCKFCLFSRLYRRAKPSRFKTMSTRWPTKSKFLARQPAVQGRDFRFVYFGAREHLRFCSKDSSSGWSISCAKASIGKTLMKSPSNASPALSASPSSPAIKEIGVTGLVWELRNFDDAILEENGRAHKSKEILRRVGLDRLDRIRAGSTSTYCRHDRRDVGELAKLHSPNH